MDQDRQLQDLVAELTGRVSELDEQIRSLKLLNARDVPEETLVAIAAAVAAYVGYHGEKKQARFAATPGWAKGTRTAQLNHQPVR